MQRLIEGVHKFRTDEFGNYRKLFRKLSQEGQNPHTLFITCSDSRVLAELITQSQPGDLFVVKNVGNIVPPANVRGDTNSTAAAIEFAVETLRVSDIVICGHSQCGAISAMLAEKPVSPSHAAFARLAEPRRAGAGDVEKKLRAPARSAARRKPPPPRKMFCSASTICTAIRACRNG